MVLEPLSLLIRHRRLARELAKREITERYLGRVFGLFWLFGHPLILIAVYVFIFAFVFKVKIGGTPEMPLDYTTYLLSGLIPWLCFQEVMGKSTTAIVAHANLVKQLVFPIEVLPVKGVLTSLVTMGIFLLSLIIYVLITTGTLLWTYTLLPLLVLVQALSMIGVSYFLASIGVFFKDLREFVQVFCLVGLYLMPTFYLPESVPRLFRPVIYLNPFSHLIWCYQDALYFGRFQHWWAWVGFVFVSLGVFVIGYGLFRKLQPLFGNLL